MASQTQIDALKAAIYSGVLVVRHGETTTQYRSLEEMRQVLAMMEAETGTRKRRAVATFRSGV